MKKKFDFVKLIYLIITILTTFICQVLRTYSYIDITKISKILSILGGIGLIIYILDIIINIKKIDKYDIFMMILAAFGIIATIYAVKPEVSVFGSEYRGEGLLIILTYYLTFLISKNLNNKKYHKLIINIILIYGFLHSIYAICQYFHIEHIFKIPIIKLRYYSTGLESNPNFYGTISIICLTISLSKSLINKRKTSILYTIISPIYFIGMLASGAMSVNVAFIIISIVMLIIMVYFRPKIKETIIKILYIIITFIICYNQFNKIDNNYMMGQLDKTKYEFSEITKGNFQDEFGTGRIYIWKHCLEISSKNLVNGIGIDNLLYGYENGRTIRDLKNRLRVDKAHNEYLQKLVTEGIFSVTTYIIFLLTIFISSIKNIIKNKDSQLISLFIPFFAYAIQAFFNISVICVAPLFYIITGLLANEGKYETA